MTFSSYLADFSCRTRSEMVKNRPFWKGGVDDFSWLSVISVILFSNWNHPCDTKMKYGFKYIIILPHDILLILILFLLKIILTQHHFHLSIFIHSFLCRLELILCVFEFHSRQGVLETTLCNKICQWLAAGWWFSLGTWLPPPIKLTAML
jgi:hypothetical protein